MLLILAWLIIASPVLAIVAGLVYSIIEENGGVIEASKDLMIVFGAIGAVSTFIWAYNYVLNNP